MQTKSRGITYYLSSTEQYEQNSAAEAYNKAIEYKTQSTLLSLPRLDLRYQSLVIEYRITYLRNRLPCRRLTVTLYEAQTGNKLHLANIRVIGCTAYVYKLTADINKLVGTKAKIERLLGFKGNSYYLVTLDNPKRLQQRYDVDFNELYPNCTNNTECNSNYEESITNRATALELGGESGIATQKRVITVDELLDSESLNKRQRPTN